jgi:hypothetical protein
MSVVADCDCASEEHICDCGRDQTWYPCDGEWDCEVCILEARIDELKDYSDTMNERMCEAFYERDEGRGTGGIIKGNRSSKMSATTPTPR